MSRLIHRVCELWDLTGSKLLDLTRSKLLDLTRGEQLDLTRFKWFLITFGRHYRQRDEMRRRGWEREKVILQRSVS